MLDDMQWCSWMRHHFTKGAWHPENEYFFLSPFPTFIYFQGNEGIFLLYTNPKRSITTGNLTTMHCNVIGMPWIVLKFCAVFILHYRRISVQSENSIVSSESSSLWDCQIEFFLFRFLRNQRSYNPPPDVASQLLGISQDALGSRLLSEWSKTPLVDPHNKYALLMRCAQVLGHAVPNSMLHQISSLGEENMPEVWPIFSARNMLDEYCGDLTHAKNFSCPTGVVLL